MEFKPKIAWWFYALEILVAATTLLMVYLAIGTRQIVLCFAAALFAALMGLLMLPMLLNTKYVLGDTQLRVVCGLYAKVIMYTDILGVNTDDASLEASPALSLDRLQIRYRNKNGSNNYVHISPKHKALFLKELYKHIGG